MVSMQQIADKVGVSRNTVSKVLNNKEGVSESIRIEILKASLEMGYKKLPVDPLQLDNLPSAKKNIMILITNPEFSQYWMQMLNGIANALNKTGSNLIYNYLYDNGQGADTVPEMIKSGNLSGMIVINVYDPGVIEKIAGSGLPTVYFDLPLHMTCAEAKGDAILFEGRHSVAKITEHLLSQGIQKIGFIGDITYARTINDRWLGFQSAHAQYGMDVDMEYCLTRGISNHFYDLDEVGQMLSRLNKLPEAFVCANDVIAYMAIKYLQSKGMKVPEDILIAGYDNIKEPLISDNSLTTVEANVSYLSRCMVKQLFDQIENPYRPYVTVTIETCPILRHSTDARLFQL